MSIKSWDFVFQCVDAKYTDRHDYCISCVHSVIKLNGQLTELLNEILAKEMIEDCIGVIVDYVIGRVVFTPLDTHKQDDNQNTNTHVEFKENIDEEKRAILPSIKRCKLN